MGALCLKKSELWPLQRWVRSVAEPRHLKVILLTSTGRQVPSASSHLPRSRLKAVAQRPSPGPSYRTNFRAGFSRFMRPQPCGVRPLRPGLRSPDAPPCSSQPKAACGSLCWWSSPRVCGHLLGLRKDFNPVGATPPLTEARWAPRLSKHPPALARCGRRTDSCSPGGANVKGNTLLLPVVSAIKKRTDKHKDLAKHLLRAQPSNAHLLRAGTLPQTLGCAQPTQLLTYDLQRPKKTPPCTSGAQSENSQRT